MPLLIFVHTIVMQEKTPGDVGTNPGANHNQAVRPECNPSKLHSSRPAATKKVWSAMFCPICEGGTRRFGWNRNGSQRYRCDACKKTFTDESTRPLDHRCVEPEKMLMILNMLLEGSSIRSLERVFHVGRNTIIRAMVEAGEKCEVFMRKCEKLVATRPNARLARKIFLPRRNALALARRLRVS